MFRVYLVRTSSEPAHGDLEQSCGKASLRSCVSTLLTHWLVTLSRYHPLRPPPAPSSGKVSRKLECRVRLDQQVLLTATESSSRGCDITRPLSRKKPAVNGRISSRETSSGEYWQR